MELPFAESYRIKMVETIRKSTREEREKWIKEAKYNLFLQWAAIMEGDESYAGARSFYRLKDTIEMLTGLPYVLPSHQGRAAENVLFSSIVKEGDILPGNSHFDTTKGHIEYRKAVALDCTIKEASNTELEIPFKGNMDLEKLEEVLKTTPREKIPCVVLTVTNNTAGGQPVSMDTVSSCLWTPPASPRTPTSSRPVRRAMRTSPSARLSMRCMRAQTI